MRIAKTYIALTMPEFREADHGDICKALGIFHPTSQPDPEWVDREQNAKADKELEKAAKV